MSQAVVTPPAEKTEHEIEKLVRQGFYISRSAFIREAVREKPASFRVIKLREGIGFQQPKREILAERLCLRSRFRHGQSRQLTWIPQMGFP